MTTKNIKKHFLHLSLSGSGKFINSIHYGCSKTGIAASEDEDANKLDRCKKVYIQAGLHADEAPGYMVMHHLIDMLDTADREGKIRGEIVCVPAANPIGFDQWIHDRLLGRFDISNGINFNRKYPDIINDTARIIEGQLTDDPDKNRKTIQDAMRIAIEKINPDDEAGALKKLLFSLSFDADIVLDLHCDNQAVMHMYTATSLWPEAEDLAAWTGAEAILLADDSGGEPYDEACSKIWWKLQEIYPDYPISPSCLAATLEYRGEADVSTDMNRQDALNIFRFLEHRGYLCDQVQIGEPLLKPEQIPSLDSETATSDSDTATLFAIDATASCKAISIPSLKTYATPLSGVEHVKSSVGGIACFFKKPGEMVHAGDKIAEIMNPYAFCKDSVKADQSRDSRITDIFCKTDGLLFSLIFDRMVRPGRILAKIAGTKEIEGKGSNLLTA
ncbi:MAG: succinylglutamate desuccinylase/aspartoacylase family protein [Desulfamplus sp.]|nr:succinylglutamate desuccinylase/aspartoacylase family protein [Desulfamplus sp.]